MGSEQLYLSNRPLIEQAIAAICRRRRLSFQDAEDFAGGVRLYLIEDDYAVLRKFQRRSSFKTYLLTVIAYRYQDWRNARWGKWRPSAEARRQGSLAVHLERLVMRDGLSFEQAHETLRTNFQVSESRDALEKMLARFPVRVGRKLVPDGDIDIHATFDSSADVSVRAQEAARAAQTAAAALSSALAGLSPQERLILRMRFEDEFSIVEIARVLHIEQRSLYRRLVRLFGQLREHLERSGVTAAAAAEILEEKGFDYVPGNTPRGGEPPGDVGLLARRERAGASTTRGR